MHWNAAVGQCALHIFSHTKMMTSGRSLDLAALSRPLQSSYTPSHSSQRGPSIPDDGNGTAWDPPPSESQFNSKLPRAHLVGNGRESGIKLRKHATLGKEAISISAMTNIGTPTSIHRWISSIPTCLPLDFRLEIQFGMSRVILT